MQYNLNKDVLVVEDDMILTVVLERYLGKLGCNVKAKAQRGDEAIDKAYKIGPELIFMDIKLNGSMDGIEAMHKIREFSDVPVIYVTGNSDSATKERAEETKFADYLVKPIMLPDIEYSVFRIFNHGSYQKT